MNDLFEGLGFLARFILGFVRLLAGLLEALMAINEIGGWMCGLWKRWRRKDEHDVKEADGRE